MYLEALASVEHADFLQDIGITHRRLTMTFDTFPVRDVAYYRTVRQYAEEWNGQQSILLVGDTGTGKTGLLFATMRVLDERHHVRDMRYFSTCDLVQGQLYDISLQDIAVLVLDDLDVCHLSRYQRERFLLLIQRRLARHLPILAASNVGCDGLSKYIGEDAAQLLFEACTVIDCDGPNLRARK
jgi:DNA replication protein DnaC